jgi:hypothetical protein
MIACAGIALLIGGYCHVYRSERLRPPMEQRYATDDGGPEYVMMGQHEFNSLVDGGYCPRGVVVKTYESVKVVVHLCEM